MARVRSQLTDPESARFERIRINKLTGIGCGAVNAKNKMGGYTGFKEFLVGADGIVAFNPEVPPGIDKASELLELSMRKIDFLATFDKNCPEANTSQS